MTPIVPTRDPSQMIVKSEPATTIPVIELGPLGNGSETIPPPTAPTLVSARVDPRYAGALQPGYPPRMMREEVEGFATVRVLIGNDGRVKTVEPVAATDPAFTEATAQQARRAWRFLPATRDGKPVESWREMTVRFTLQ